MSGGETAPPATDQARVHYARGVLTFALNRPEARNALNAATIADLDRVLTFLEGSAEARALILTGDHGTFCAGGDLGEFLAGGLGDAHRLEAQNRAFGALLQRITALPQCVIARVEGAAFGGGFGLAAIADVVIAEAGARFALSETSLGLIPAQIAPFVALRIGVARTRRLAMTGEKLDAASGLAIGLVDHVETGAEALARRTEAVVAGVLRCAPRANGTTKALLGAIATRPLPDLLDDSARAFAASLTGAEGREGLTAFAQRRAPEWAETSAKPKAEPRGTAA